jgi:hypothetical protein
VSIQTEEGERIGIFSLYDAKQFMSCLRPFFSKLGQCQIGVFVILIASMKMHFTRFGNKGRKNQLIIHICRLKFIRP